MQRNETGWDVNEVTSSNFLTLDNISCLSSCTGWGEDYLEIKQLCIHSSLISWCSRKVTTCPACAPLKMGCLMISRKMKKITMEYVYHNYIHLSCSLLGVCGPVLNDPRVQWLGTPAEIHQQKHMVLDLNGFEWV